MTSHRPARRRPTNGRALPKSRRAWLARLHQLRWTLLETMTGAGVLACGNWQSVARRKLLTVHAALNLRDLLAPPGNRLEILKGDRAGQHSIRINDQFRVCFVWTANGPADVEIVDYH